MLYLDTSAAAKLLVREKESHVLSRTLDDAADRGVRLVSSLLLETELRRLAVRESIEQASVTAVLARVDLYETPPSLYHQAGLLPGVSLRSLDALHLAAAIRIGVEALITYDTRQALAAVSLGLVVDAPA